MSERPSEDPASISPEERSRFVWDQEDEEAITAANENDQA